MNIAIEALGIHYFGGGRSATMNLLEALFAIDQQNEYLLFLSRPEPSLVTPAGNVRQHIVAHTNRLALRLWAQRRLPGLVAGCDLVHFIKNLGVFGIRPPSVVTMYDMTTLIHPELFPRLDVWYWRMVQPRTLAAAARIIAISQNTADDIQRFYPVTADKIEVIYPAHAAHFKPATAEEIAAVRRLYKLPDRFVLHLGRIDRKKNLSLLVDAFAQFRSRTGYGGKLVLVGEEYAKSRDDLLHATIARHRLSDAVLFTGAVPDGDAPALFSASEVTVFPSRHEGFGIVPLEALACGAPVIASRAGAVYEAVGDAAIMLDAPDADLLADALTLVTSQPALQAALRQRGLIQAQHFSWDHAARRTLQLYAEVVGRRDGKNSL